MKAPDWFVKALAGIDPYLRVVFDRDTGEWEIIRLWNAPSRGNKRLPTRWLEDVGGGFFKPKEVGISVMHIPHAIDEVGDYCLQILRAGNTWERPKIANNAMKRYEANKVSVDRKADDAFKYAFDVGKRIVDKNPFVDQGARSAR